MNERLGGAEAHSVDLWLAFAAMQTRFFSGESLRARQQSILEQAVAKNPNEHRLYLELLQIEGLVESREVLLGLWQKILVKFNSIPDVVVAFLRFLRWRHWSSVRNFSMEDVRRCYAAALHCLIASGRANESLVLSVFQDLVAMEHLAGYDERAVALVQALIEFNSAPIAQARADFARFWALNIPRIGSAGYEGGFAHWLQTRSRWGPKANNDDFDDMLALNKWASPGDWVAKERSLSSASASISVADPDSVTTIEDVAPFLFEVAVIEPIVMFVLRACGIDVRPSFTCDEPALRFGRDFAFRNGSSLIVPPEFAQNMCAAMMAKQNPRLYCVLQLRCVLRGGEGMFQAGASLLGGFRSSVDLFCEFADCLARGGDVAGAARVLGSLPASSMVYAMRALLQVQHKATAVLPSVEEAASALKGALEEQVPRSTLWAGVVMGCLLVLKRQLRDAIALFESVAEALGGDAGDAVVCRGLLLEAYLIALQSAEGWESDARSSVLEAVTSIAIRAIPTSAIVQRVLQQLKPKQAVSLLDAALARGPNASLSVLASQLSSDSERHRFLEVALGSYRHDVGVWIAYLDLMSASRKDCEKILCRALRAMPWSKELWLRMMELCVTGDDKRELFRLMVNKCIRVRLAIK
jgi:hypothetical protein